MAPTAMTVKDANYARVMRAPRPRELMNRNSRFPRVVSAAAAVIALPLLMTSCIYPSPSPGPNALLRGVAAVNTSNAYAVGSFQDSTGMHDLMEHWNGKSWQEVFLPPP